MGTISVDAIIEGGPSRKPLAQTIGLCFVLMVCDCFDILALAVAARSLIVEWQLSSATIGLLLSAGTFGLLVGSIIFGWVGDRFGRKRAIILGSLLFSVLTTLTGFMDSAAQLATLRFLAGLGLGGAVPNAVALVRENAPKRFAATAVGIIYAGYAVGGILVGIIASAVVPTLGWRWLFFIGGAMSFASMLAFMKWLPESMPYLAAQPSRQADAVALAHELRPDLVLPPDTRFLVPEKSVTNAKVGDLFKGQLRVATPLLWLAYIASSMTASFLASWLPATAEDMGLSQRIAPLTFACLFAGSAIGGIIGGHFVDRRGVTAIVPLALLSIPAIAGLGLLNGAPLTVLLLSTVVGVLAFGCQTCVISVVGSFYPVTIRATGVGWAVAIAKFGAMAGSYIGGILLARVGLEWVFLCGAVPMLVLVLLAFVLRGYQTPVPQNVFADLADTGVSRSAA
jgi:AAHS family 4-hydroxybenzoate transporter-like MFS transporter